MDFLCRVKASEKTNIMVIDKQSIGKDFQLDSQVIEEVSEFQGRSQPHSPGWARVPLSSFFPQILIHFSYFSSSFSSSFWPSGWATRPPEGPGYATAEFSYLWSLINTNSDSTTEIKRRLAIATTGIHNNACSCNCQNKHS